MIADLRYRLRSLRRYALLAVGVFLPLAGISIGISGQMPERYEAQAVFVLDPRQSGAGPNPGELMRVLALKAEGRDQLRQLQTTHSAFAEMSVTSLEDHLKIWVNSGREKATVTTIETSGNSAERAYLLAQGTQEFLANAYLSHVSATRSDHLAQIEDRARIAETALAEASSDHTALAPVDPRDLQAMRDQITLLDRRISRQQIAPAQTDTARDRLTEQLSAALSRLSSDHPKVKLLEAELEALPPKATAQSTEAELATLTTARSRLSEELAQLLSRSEQLKDTRKALSLARAEHTAAIGALDRARRQAETDLARERARLNLVVPAEIPEAPRFPSPAWIALFGIILSGLTAFGAVLLASRLDQKIRVPADLDRRFGIVPFATFPNFPMSDLKA